MQNQEDNFKEKGSENGPEGTNTDIKTDKTEATDEKAASDNIQDIQKELNDKYLRLYSEFDNYRKRTVKEKAEIIKTAAEDVFKAILPVIDDFDRAMKANETVQEADVIKEGMQLIYNKLKNISQQKGLTAFESVGETFDPDIMDAITHVPAEDTNQKGKVIEEIEKGYKLGNKVIRHAKVIIAQ
jgi:molecular chaperone GrpE